MVVARPLEGNVQTVEMADENQDLEVDHERMYLDGNVEYKRPKRLPYYEYKKLPSWRKKVIETHKVRNQPHAQILRMAGMW